MVRVFVAVEVENLDVLKEIINARDEVLACTGGGRGIKGVEDENIHLTLRFLGEVSEPLLATIKECVRGLSTFKEFEIEVRGLGAFPSPSRPRVIWVGVGLGADNLKLMRKTLESCVKGLVQPDRAEFKPHITIARIMGSYDRGCLAEILNRYADRVFGRSRITEVKLKKSTLTPKGPIYEDLLVVKLKA